MIRLEEYQYFFIACEGKNEEAAFKYIQDNERLKLRKEAYSTDYIRTHSHAAKMRMLESIVGYSFQGKVAILDIRDREKESWRITRKLRIVLEQNGIEIIPVITHPEIEYLLILSNETAMKTWNQYKEKDRRANASGFCRKYFKQNIKGGDNFLELFGDFATFAKACHQYQKDQKYKGALTLWDLILPEA